MLGHAEESGRGHVSRVVRPGCRVVGRPARCRGPSASRGGVAGGSRPAMRANAVTSSASPRRPGSTPAARSTASAAGRATRPSRPAPRAASCGAARRRRRRPRTRPARSPGGGGSRRTKRDQAGVHVRHRPEHRPRRPRRPGGRRVPGRLDRRHAVGAGAGRGGQPLRHLGLHHDQPVPQRGQQLQQVQHHRHGDVVRQVGDQRGRRRAGDARSAGARRAATHASARRPGRGRPVGDRRAAARPASTGSISTAITCRGRVEQAEGQRAEPGPTSSATSSGSSVGGAHDPADRVRVVQEVLPQRLGRPHPELGGQRADLRRPQQARPPLTP